MEGRSRNLGQKLWRWHNPQALSIVAIHEKLLKVIRKTRSEFAAFNELNGNMENLSKFQSIKLNLKNPSKRSKSKKS